MYSCKNCSKEYTSQKHYLSHIIRCQEEDRRSARSSRSTTRSNPGYESAIETVEKLSSDKNDLKEKLKTCMRQISNLKAEHRGDVEKIQEYFESQMLSLKEENEELAEQACSERERSSEILLKRLFEEKKKIEAKCEKRYEQKLAKLNSSISKLREDLNSQIEKTEALKETHENEMFEKEEANKAIVENLISQLNDLKRSSESERSDMRRIASNFNNDKELFKIACEREKDAEIEKLIVANRTAIMVLESSKEELERKLTLLEKECSTKLLESARKYEELSREKAQELRDMENSYTQELEHQHNIFEGRIEDASKKHLLEKKEYTEKMEDKIVGIELTNSRILESLHDEKKRMEEEFETLVLEERRKKVVSEERLESALKNAKEELERTREELCGKLSETCRKYEEAEKTKNSLERELSSDKNTIRMMTERAEEELCKIKLDYDTSLDEYKRTVQSDFEKSKKKSEEEASSCRSEMDVMKKDVDRLKSTFISNLNKQKTMGEVAIKERDDKIKEIELAIVKTNEECADKLSKTKFVLEELEKKNKEFQDKESSLKTEIINLKKESDDVKCEAEKDANEKIGMMEDVYRAEINAAQQRERLKESELMELRKSFGNVREAVERELKEVMNAELKSLEESARNEIKILQQRDSLKETELTELRQSLKNARETVEREMNLKLNASKLQIELLKGVSEQAKANAQKEVESIKKASEEAKSSMEKEMKIRIESTCRSVEKMKSDANLMLEAQKKELENKNKQELVQLQSLLEAKKQELGHMCIGIRNSKSEQEAKIEEVKKERDEEIEKIKKDMERLKTAFVDNLNKQKDMSEIAINEREAYISQLEGIIEKNKETQKELEKYAREGYVPKTDSDVYDQEKEEALSAKQKEIEDLRAERDKIKLESMQKLNATSKELREKIQVLEKDLSEKNGKILEVEAKSVDNTALINKNSHLEMNVKKMREDFIDNIKKQKAHAENIEARNTELLKKLKHVEDVAVSKDAEVHRLVKAQEDLKQQFLSNLNQQKTENERLLSCKDDTIMRREARISELEKLHADLAISILKK